MGTLSSQRNRTTSLIRKAKNSYHKKLNADLCDVQSISNKKWWGLVKQVYDNRYRTFCRKTLCRKTFCRTDILSTDILFCRTNILSNGQFDERTFRRKDILPKRQLAENREILGVVTRTAYDWLLIHSIGMNSRATPLKFVCPRISHYACY